MHGEDVLTIIVEMGDTVDLGASKVATLMSIPSGCK